MANSPTGDSTTVRLLRVLETFTSTRTVQTASEIGRRAGLPASTAHRIVSELVGAGILERGHDRRVRIGMRLWEVATRSSDTLLLRQAALPYLERVQARVGEHTQLAVLEQDAACFLERLSAARPSSGTTRIADRLPLHGCAPGLVLLAHADRETQDRVLTSPMAPLTRETVVDTAVLRRTLANVRRVGYCIAPGHIEPVTTGVAVPARDGGGRVVAALSVVLRGGTPPETALEELLAAARGTERASTHHQCEPPSGSTRAIASARPRQGSGEALRRAGGGVDAP